VNAQSVVIPWPRRIVISIVLLICGLLVFVFGTNYYSVFPTNDSQAYRAILAAIFLGAALVLQRDFARLRSLGTLQRPVGRCLEGPNPALKPDFGTVMSKSRCSTTPPLRSS